MKVILKQDVNKLGASGDLVEVADGYARNYLFPRGLAEEATPERIRAWKSRETSRKKKEEKLLEDARAVQRTLSGRTVRVRGSAGEKGKLFGSITASNVADAIEAAFSVQVDRRDVRLPDSVKQTGSYPFTVRLLPGVEVDMTLSVEAE